MTTFKALPESGISGYVAPAIGPAPGVTRLSPNRRRGAHLAVAGAGALAAVVAVASVPGVANAGTVSGAGAGWSISVDIPDFTWSSYGCNDVPFSVSTAGDVGEWTVVMPVRLTGSGRFSDTAMASGEGATSLSDTIVLCPNDLSGTYLASGMARGGTPESFPKLETSFQVSPMSSSTALAQIAVTAKRTKFSGWVSATSATLGAIGGKPGTKVEIQRQSNGAWNTVASTKVDNLGNYAASLPKVYKAGTAFRAHYVGATEVAPSTSEALGSPAGVPTKPVLRTLTRSIGAAKLTWRSQGSGVSYKYRIAAPGLTYGAWTATKANGAKFTGLYSGAKYRVQVVATSEVGTSKATSVTFRSR